MAMKPWYKVVTPRKDLREGKPLDASEFAVHLDHVRNGTAEPVYTNPAEFFDRTYITKSLRELAVQVVRRLNGEKVETSAVFNLSTQFGGGKTHALTFLYHLAKGGDNARQWKGVQGILQEAGVSTIPANDPVVFVGTEFDSLTGRGGTNGEPLRKTPWGEIAFQIGGAKGFSLLAEHDAKGIAPAGDVIEQMVPHDRPVMILLDEMLNYISKYRKTGLTQQFYNFLHTLARWAPSRNNVVLVASLPASEIEMTDEDHGDFDRFKKLLDAVGKAMVMSAEAETSEIIRRRLFEWEGVPQEAEGTIAEYSNWVQANKLQLPTWFPFDNAAEIFREAYPFHPSVLSVFERKWQALPRFQQTRGVLRLLALWVSKAYGEGFKDAHKDPLITLGSAPLDDARFRPAMFEQLGENRLEPAVTTDIAGKDDSHALRLDAEAKADVKNARLHRKVATVIFFESNGGQQKGEATQGEVHLATAEPGVEIGSVDQSLEALIDNCYYLNSERNRFRFSFQPNLNKLLADRKASVNPAIPARVKQEIQKVFSGGTGVERVYFPDKSNQIPDRPVLSLVILPPEHSMNDPETKGLIASMTTEYGNSSRTFKSALIWAVPEDGSLLNEEARKLLAWLEIEAEADDLKLDEVQTRKVGENIRRAERDLREAVWRTYKNILVIEEDQSFHKEDLGMVHSSSAGSLVDLILKALKDVDLLAQETPTPRLLQKSWPPALPEWSTRAVRDAFYASPKFPRLTRQDAVKDTLARGIGDGLFAYVGKRPDGEYVPFVFKELMQPYDIEIADDVYIIPAEKAEEYQRRKTEPPPPPPPPPPARKCPSCGKEEPEWNDSLGKCQACGYKRDVAPSPPPPPQPPDHVKGFKWTGEIAPQKWMNFYTKVLSRFATGGGLRITLSVEVEPPGGVSTSKVEETEVALRELGMEEEINPTTGDRKQGEVL